MYADSGKIFGALRFTYKRNGTLNLFAALEIASGSVSAKTIDRKTRNDFLAFMDEVVSDHMDMDVHVILDNYCTHKRCDEWLKAHPRVHFHYPPHVCQLDEPGRDLVLLILPCNTQGCKLREHGGSCVCGEKLRL